MREHVDFVEAIVLVRVIRLSAAVLSAARPYCMASRPVDAVFGCSPWQAVMPTTGSQAAIYTIYNVGPFSRSVHRPCIAFRV